MFPELTPLDHDQRNTLSVGGDVTLPGGSYASTNINYFGSGFHNAFPGQPYPGDYLPANTTVDLAFGKDFGKKYALSLNVLNVTNERVELDNSLTFGGFHWNNHAEKVYASAFGIGSTTRRRKAQKAGRLEGLKAERLEGRKA